MKNILLLIAALSTLQFSHAQSKIADKYAIADSFFRQSDYDDAYRAYKDLYLKIDATDTLYEFVVWYLNAATSQLEQRYRMKEDFSKSLTYGLEALKLLQANKARIGQKFADREAWMTKNIVVSYVGLGNFDEADKYRSALYKYYRDSTLPKGLDKYFNYDFFTLSGKNVWGYEWFADLPDDRFSTSFTKIVYYIYSTNPDGTDKNQLCRYHVLMFHQDPKDAKFDYILERQIESDSAIVSGSYYEYNYKKAIDYTKLKADIKEIITKDVQPITRRVVQKRKQ